MYINEWRKNLRLLDLVSNKEYGFISIIWKNESTYWTSDGIR
jgi:hypothetical protein